MLQMSNLLKKQTLSLPFTLTMLMAFGCGWETINSHLFVNRFPGRENPKYFQFHNEEGEWEEVR